MATDIVELQEKLAQAWIERDQLRTLVGELLDAWANKVLPSIGGGADLYKRARAACSGEGK